MCNESPCVRIPMCICRNALAPVYSNPGFANQNCPPRSNKNQFPKQIQRCSLLKTGQCVDYRLNTATKGTNARQSNVTCKAA